jgi:AcrR family transcriptional regulator
VTDPDDTPSRLVAAAERLFAEAGEAATSLRAVARMAHANAAAVHYHFGGRDELLLAVYDRHAAPLAQRRSRALAEAAAADPPTAPGIVAALVRPDLELLAKLRRHRVEVARFLGRAGQGSVIGTAVARRADEVIAQALPALRRAVPGVGDDELTARLGLVLRCVQILYATAEESGGPGPLGSDDVDEQVRRLVAFAAAGLCAPPSPTPRGKSGRKRRKDG